MTNKEELEKEYSDWVVKHHEDFGSFPTTSECGHYWLSKIEQIRKSDMERLIIKVNTIVGKKHDFHEDWEDGDCDCDGTFDHSEVLTIIKQDTPCKHVSDGLSYTSNPPQSRCIECGSFYR